MEYICAMSCTIAFDQWASPIEDLGSYEGPGMNGHFVFTTMKNKAQEANHSIESIWHNQACVTNKFGTIRFGSS